MTDKYMNKMVSITRCQENANKRDSEMSSH